MYHVQVVGKACILNLKDYAYIFKIIEVLTLLLSVIFFCLLGMIIIFYHASNKLTVPELIKFYRYVEKSFILRNIP